MTRRELAASVMAAGAAAALPSVAAATPVLRTVFRRVGSEWVRCRMFEVQPGDLIRIVLEDGTTNEGTARCVPQKDGRHWGVWTEVRPRSS